MCVYIYNAGAPNSFVWSLTVPQSLGIYTSSDYIIISYLGTDSDYIIITTFYRMEIGGRESMD